MNRLAFNRYALSAGALAALLVGCSEQRSAFVPQNGTRSVFDAREASASTGAFSVVYSFKGGGNGNQPGGALKEVNGVLYGATDFGGYPKCGGKVYGCGTAFSLTPAGDQVVVYRFLRPGGYNPLGSFTQLHGSLYGLSANGGTGTRCGIGTGCGTLFELTLSGRERTIYNFKGEDAFHDNGSFPQGNLVFQNGKFYGVTADGGDESSGTIFAVDLAGKERMLHQFQGSPKDGDTPQDGLIQVDGTLYGTTSAGGKSAAACRNAFGNSCGTIFSITPAGDYRVLYRFNGGRDAAYPVAGLLYFNGGLYGTTLFGGNVNSDCPAGCGTVFEVDPSSGREHVIYRFTGGANGNAPDDGLVAYRGMLYGVTAAGGTASGKDCILRGGCGTIFRVSPAGKERTLHIFTGADGAGPGWRLLLANGSLYGETIMGGIRCHNSLFGCGVVFKFTP